MIKGRIHSIETMGLVDGPGIRTVVFLQGCQLRCRYCHNPDTWRLKGGKEMTVDELVKIVKRYKIYYKNKGGVTLSGGEPLLQPQFVLEFFKRCKEEGIHTTLDTAGHGCGDKKLFKEILQYTDLVLLDIKALDEKGYFKLTGGSQKEALEFLDIVQEVGTPMWIRHVVVPGINDNEENIVKLAEFVNNLSNVEKCELLPYHVHGIKKYKELNIKYTLEGIKAMDEERFIYLNNILAKHLNIPHKVPSKVI
ncbi:pyruvate formate lyase activating enzyme [Anaerobranca californiensis DSM 14826]|jgi:pyruvate formate lyase activating enzyme|uniref:Pyruvate formate-lyase-activating enzyme n=1 Tax=Anaerobranca californiensis DSM 14826 TaxID=1120989 RepID=A0A1M6LFW1_9FIRM|nr:pyruvate formate-lyase-activating protein [Anaerobranca californiensis]SHJ70097.1 pyruvate formate lyase activating enzyme [Anaerobranca californiensis DSM 14826]